MEHQDNNSNDRLTSRLLPEYVQENSEESALFSMQEMAAIVSKRWRLMLVCVVLVVAPVAVYMHRLRSAYEAAAVILVASDKPSALPGGLSAISGIQSLMGSGSVNNAVEVMSSPDTLEPVYKTLDKSLRLKGFGSVNLPGDTVQIIPKKTSSAVEIKVRAFDPEAAAALANAIAVAFFKMDREESNETSYSVSRYVKGKLEWAEAELEKANAELAEYKKETGLIVPEQQMASIVELAGELQNELETSRVESAAAQIEKDALSGELTPYNIEEHERYSAIQGEIDELISEKEELSKEYQPGSIEMRSIEERIADAKNRLGKLEQNLAIASHTNISSRIQALSEAIDQHKAAARKLPDQEKRFIALLQRVKLLERSVEVLAERYYSVLFDEKSVLPNGRLITRARVPGGPSYPPRNKNIALSFVLGLAISVLAALAAERLDSKVCGQDEAERAARRQALAVVPELARGQAPSMHAVAPHSPFAESFRILRNGIFLGASDVPAKVIGVTSCGLGEGKTTVCANLALATALDGKRVVIVDANLRRPRIHSLLDIRRNIGYTNVVSGTCSLDEAVLETGVERLYVLPAGPALPDSAELINSDASRKMLRRLAEQFDVVLLDCPKTSGQSDMQVISSMVDGLLLVVSLNRTTRPALEHVTRFLLQSGAPLLGLVINSAPVGKWGSGYYGYDEEPAGREPEPGGEVPLAPRV